MEALSILRIILCSLVCITYGRAYRLQGTVWKKVQNEGKPLTWRYGAPPTVNVANNGLTKDLSVDDVRNLLKKAMQMWTDHTNVKFEEIVDGTPDMWIYFAKGSHGDPYHFDGPGGTRGHAFYPLTNIGLAGDIHFDDAEWFTKGTSDGTNFLWVATHQLGHSLGLDHSNVRGSVMFPYYGGYQPNFQLHEDDISAIQKLYGKKKKYDEPFCPISIKAMWVKGSTKGYLVTSQDEFFNVDIDGNMEKVRAPIQESVDAAFTGTIYRGSSEKYTVVFSGQTYTVYTTVFTKISGPHSIHYTLDDSGMPNPLNLQIPTHVDRIDAAMKWNLNDILYVFYSTRGRGYYRKYDLKTGKLIRRRGKVDLSIENWRLLPQNGIDSAVSWKGNTFFARGGEVYKLDDRKFKVAQGYPKTFGDGEFLKCRKIEQLP